MLSHDAMPTFGASSQGNSLFVPGTYSTIQGAINAAQPGDTIYVAAGNYYENIVVKKDNLTIVGHGSSDTVVFGNVTGRGFEIDADQVSVSGFKVTDCETGILVNKAYTCSITDNYVTNSKFGIWLSFSAYCYVQRNTVVDCEHNLRLSYSKNNTLTDNSIRGDNSYNFGLFGSSMQHYFQSIDASNTVNGKPIRYITNVDNLVISPQTYPDLGCLLVINSSRITVKDLTISNNLDAILFAYVSNSTIQNVNVVNNKIGVEFFNSPNCAVLNSYVEGNMYQGILATNSPQCVIVGNDIISNTDGILLSSNSCSIQRNTIVGNEVGLRLDSGFGNVFLHNNIINNREQVDVANSQGNIFDDGKEGNYWSNYRGEDTNYDAVGDTSIPHEQVDNHPLMGEYQECQVTKGSDNYVLEIISGGTISDLRLNETKGTLLFEAFTNKSQSFTRIILPKTLVSNASIVTVNNSQVFFSKVNFNDTHATVYVEYPLGSSEIEIGAASIAPLLIAEAGANQSATTGEIVKFDGSKSTGNFGIKSYKWNFGDGGSATGANVTHIFTQPGNYTVILEVTDNQGNRASDSLTVTVEQSSGNTSDEPESDILAKPNWLITFAVVMNFLAVDAILITVIKKKMKKKKIAQLR